MSTMLLRLWMLIVVCALFVKPIFAQERMRIAWAGSTPSNTPIWVADQKGFFKKNGLNAQVIAISASTIVIQALLTGEVDFIIAPSATLVTSRLAGADTIMVSTNLPLFIDHIVSLCAASASIPKRKLRSSPQEKIRSGWQPYHAILLNSHSLENRW